MMVQIVNIDQSLKVLKHRISEADSKFDNWVSRGDEWDEPTWLIDICFIQLLAIAEAIQLPDFRNLVLTEYNAIKDSKQGLVSASQMPDGEPYSYAIARLRRFVKAVEPFFPEEGPTLVVKEVLEIIRDVHYVITDKNLFGHAPSNEYEVQIRIEGILKCVFPDLKHKPTLTKAIKNFEPDTGIPSIETLIEYKFLSCAKDVGRIADEMLADTRGYISKEWSQFLYVVYETNRFRTQKDWSQFFKQSGISDNTRIVVLSGEPVEKPRKRKKKKDISPA